VSCANDVTGGGCVFRRGTPTRRFAPPSPQVGGMKTVNAVMRRAQKAPIPPRSRRAIRARFGSCEAI
jgi:hypothetical protein